LAPDVIVRGEYVDELPFDKAIENGLRSLAGSTQATVIVAFAVLALGDAAL
jgi:hypothetical protein